MVSNECPEGKQECRWGNHGRPLWQFVFIKGKKPGFPLNAIQVSEPGFYPGGPTFPDPIPPIDPVKGIEGKTLKGSPRRVYWHTFKS